MAKHNPKPSKAATGSARKMKRRAKGGAVRTVLKHAKRPVQKVKPASKKTARKATKAKPAANKGAKLPSRPTRARRAPSATAATGAPEPAASYSQETAPAEVLPSSNAAPEMTRDLMPKQPT